MKVVISSGHGKYVRGASGYIDEVDEARKVVEEVAEDLRAMHVGVVTFHDDVSHSQNENLNRIVDFHNSQTRDFDISVHFNAYQTTSKPMGCEVLYVSSTGEKAARKMVDAICDSAGLINRGPKKRTDLAFLNGTEEPAILIETCFVDSKADVDIYHALFDDICGAIAEVISGTETAPPVEPPVPPDVMGFEETVMTIADNSIIADYSWKDRGKAPPGYIKGFALAWATVVKKYYASDEAAALMAEANSGDEAVDALAWFTTEMAKIGMTNNYTDIHTLRHLFVLLMGLGMRESSGRHCEGRDMSASNVTADTAEAGLYQTSYNAHTCSEQFDEVMDDYLEGRYPGYMQEFAEGVTCNSESWQNYGSGNGATFQKLCKEAPAFAVESCAITLRKRRQHYGPINRKEVELKNEADWMLLEVQRYVESGL